ncbi:MAG: hypothetical protein KJ727_02045 [Acidobacteria bacterium]|nr:hypothetical protein [Acidobacteriota bacterium]MBU4329154.1 hypothetical protein [Acidobacteriota bacterium]MBU4495071.1 hypothetical protein [Acidobacteriota bacterium]
MYLLLFCTPGCGNGGKGGGVRFEILFSNDVSAEPLDGRMLLFISRDPGQEPRFQVGDGPDSQQVFGIDVDGLRPNTPAVIDGTVFGYPLESLSAVPTGEYFVQAFLNRYETFTRADGHTVKLPPDKGEGQQWSRKPGNLYSTPVQVRIDPGKKKVIALTLDQIIPPIEPPADTKYIKHIRIQSKKLSEFWGRPMYLGAVVLLPEGFDEHPEARYPLVIDHGHFPRTFDGFREEPPDPDLEPQYSDRFKLDGYNRIVQEQAHAFFKEWTGPDYPRMVLIKVQHANPFYDDSYAVNSANLGPYGDAIIYELVPHVEKEFRCIGEGWARFTYGGSTGGWEALAVQVLYPEEYNGCFAACPDPIDFRAYTVVDIYEDKNAYFLDGPWKKTPRPGQRDFLGHIKCTLRDMNHLELVLGSMGRSGGQWDIWQAVFSPVDENGYPKPIWNKYSGEIDPAVAAYWKENYDLRYIMERDWDGIGPSLQGKIHIYCGDMDNYYLNNAVYLTEEFLINVKNPTFDGHVDYGDRAEHCWNGDHDLPNALSRLRYAQMFMPKMVERMRKTAPPGADLTSWRY